MTSAMVKESRREVGTLHLEKSLKSSWQNQESFRGQGVLKHEGQTTRIKDKWLNLLLTVQNKCALFFKCLISFQKRKTCFLLLSFSFH